jgi:hypothetical protein
VVESRDGTFTARTEVPTSSKPVGMLLVTVKAPMLKTRSAY